MPAKPTVVTNPLTNRGTAFTIEERRRLGLIGRFPSAVETLDQQAARTYRQLCGFEEDMDKYVFLDQLHDRNETFYYIARRAIGLPLLYPDPKCGYVDDFLHMTFGMPYQFYEIDPAVVRALDMLLILHADHEQNCSTSTVRLVGSADANMYASVAAGIGALSGPLHGGANEAVLRMLDAIQTEGT